MPNWSLAEDEGQFCPLWLEQESQWSWPVEELWGRLGLTKPSIVPSGNASDRRQGATTYMFVHALAWFGGDVVSAYRDVRVFVQNQAAKNWASKVLLAMLHTLGAKVEQASASVIRVKHHNGSLGTIRVFSEKEQPLPTIGTTGNIFLDSTVSTLTPVRADNSIMSWHDMLTEGGCFAVAEDRVARREHSMTNG